MSVSKTEICNLALGKLGAGRISNIEEDTTEKAVLCRLYYESVVEEVLRSHEWNCAIWYQSLTALAETDDDYLLEDYEGYSYQFQLPTAPRCLRVLGIREKLLSKRGFLNSIFYYLYWNLLHFFSFSSLQSPISRDINKGGFDFLN